MESEYQDRDKNFEKLFKTCIGPLSNYVNSYLHKWDRSRELVHDVFMKVWENRENLSLQDAPKEFLFSEVHNKLVEVLKTEFPKKKSDIGNVDENIGQLDSFILRGQILEAKEKMKPQMKKIFTLRMMEQLTYSEIASYLNLPKKEVLDLAAKSLTFLKKDIKNRQPLLG